MENRKNIYFEENKGRFRAGFNKVMNSEKISKENKENYQRYIDRKRSEGVSHSRLANVTSYFYLITTNFIVDKKLLEINMDDYTRMTLSLIDGDFLNNKGKVYSGGSIQNFQRFIKSYFNCLLGEIKTKERFGKLKIKDFVF